MFGLKEEPSVSVALLVNRSLRCIQPDARSSLYVPFGINMSLLVDVASVISLTCPSRELHWFTRTGSFNTFTVLHTTLEVNKSVFEKAEVRTKCLRHVPHV